MLADGVHYLKTSRRNGLLQIPYARIQQFLLIVTYCFFDRRPQGFVSAFPIEFYVIVRDIQFYAHRREVDKLFVTTFGHHEFHY